MESDLGKLFIGGISWDTNDKRLRDYFTNYGEVVEAVIMKDRTTGRARGFGFVVFADPTVAERVVLEKHTIDGRVVEAKKAVPRDDQHAPFRNNSGIVHGSPGPSRTKKIFVGGLASTVTETDFKKYFDQFGTITDVVVMYDHNTQRPRGFGFITYDSEDAVDKVLLKTFHELNGKMVEVKRAVPKELSPGPAMRSPIGNYSNYGLNRLSSLNFFNGYGQGFSPPSMRGYGTRLDARPGSLVGSRGGYSPFSPPGYGVGVNVEGGQSPSYVGNTNYNSNFGFARGLNTLYTGNSGRFGSPIGFNSLGGGSGSMISSNARNVWGATGLNFGTTTSAPSSSFLGSGSGSFGGFGNNDVNWGGSSSISTQLGGGSSGYGSGNLGYGGGDNNYGIGGSSYRRNSGIGDMNSSYTASNALYDGGNYADLCTDVSWRSGSSELEGSSPFDYGLSNVASDPAVKGSTGYNAGYNVADRQSSRGIAA